jgi:hypothetical protein
MFEAMSDAMNVNTMHDVLAKMSDARLERRLMDARGICQFIERMMKRRLPFQHVTYGLFSVVLLATHGSAHARWARRWLAREARARGFASIEEALISLHEQVRSSPATAPS